MIQIYYQYIIILLIILIFKYYRLTKEHLTDSDDKYKNKIYAYLSKPSYFINEKIELKISSPFKKCKFELLNIHPKTNKIYNISINDYDIIMEDKILTKSQNIPKYSFASGCNWNTTYSFYLDKNLPSDLYIIKLSSNNILHYLILTIKNHKPSSNNIILINTNTWQAYNYFGGASLYTYKISDTKYKILNGSISTQLSYDRPYLYSNNRITEYLYLKKDKSYQGIHLIYNELIFLKWCKLKSIKYDVITDYDLHYNYNILPYKNFILCGHPEYWTPQMIEYINKYQQNNGNITSLGGNSIYRKISINYNIIKPYKNKPISGTYVYNNSKYYYDIINNIVGNLYDKYGYRKYYDYKKIKDHWIYNGLTLKNNENICKTYKPLGHELDKIINKNANILARGPYNTGLIIYNSSVGKGQIFSVGSITYCSCLLYEPNLSTITHNVIKKFEM